MRFKGRKTTYQLIMSLVKSCSFEAIKRRIMPYCFKSLRDFNMTNRIVFCNYIRGLQFHFSDTEVFIPWSFCEFCSADNLLKVWEKDIFSGTTIAILCGTSAFSDNKANFVALFVKHIKNDIIATTFLNSWTLNSKRYILSISNFIH